MYSAQLFLVLLSLFSVLPLVSFAATAPKLVIIDDTNLADQDKIKRELYKICDFSEEKERENKSPSSNGTSSLEREENDVFLELHPELALQKTFPWLNEAEIEEEASFRSNISPVGNDSKYNPDEIHDAVWDYAAMVGIDMNNCELQRAFKAILMDRRDFWPPAINLTPEMDIRLQMHVLDYLKLTLKERPYDISATDFVRPCPCSNFYGRKECSECPCCGYYLPSELVKMFFKDNCTITSLKNLNLSKKPCLMRQEIEARYGTMVLRNAFVSAWDHFVNKRPFINTRLPQYQLYSCSVRGAFHERWLAVQKMALEDSVRAWGAFWFTALDQWMVQAVGARDHCGYVMPRSLSEECPGHMEVFDEKTSADHSKDLRLCTKSKKRHNRARKHGIGEILQQTPFNQGLLPFPETDSKSVQVPPSPYNIMPESLLPPYYYPSMFQSFQQSHQYYNNSVLIQPNGIRTQPILAPPFIASQNYFIHPVFPTPMPIYTSQPPRPLPKPKSFSNPVKYSSTTTADGTKQGKENKQSLINQSATSD